MVQGGLSWGVTSIAVTRPPRNTPAPPFAEPIWKQKEWLLWPHTWLRGGPGTRCRPPGQAGAGGDLGGASEAAERDSLSPVISASWDLSGNGRDLGEAALPAVSWELEGSCSL